MLLSLWPRIESLWIYKPRREAPLNYLPKKLLPVHPATPVMRFSIEYWHPFAHARVCRITCTLFEMVLTNLPYRTADTASKGTTAIITRVNRQLVTKIITSVPREVTMFRSSIETLVVTVFCRTLQSSESRLSISPVRFSSKKETSVYLGAQ